MPKIRGLRWWMIGLIMLGSIVNYLTRSTLAVAAPTLLKDLHIGEQQYSWIGIAFQLAIMAQPIVGYVLDVLGLKIGLAIFVVAWALVNMAHGWANSWQALAGLRGLMGFAEERILRQSPNVFLCVSAFNRRAQKFYERLGYQRVGELPDFLVQGQAEILMRKTRGPLFA